jgi:predicted  nucleic acid-binding Zn-ribbon protein
MRQQKSILKRDLVRATRSLALDRKELARAERDIVSHEAVIADVQRLLKVAKTEDVIETLTVLLKDAKYDRSNSRYDVADLRKSIREDEKEIAAIKEEM